MPALLVVLLVVVPLVEIVIIVQVGQTLGAAWTILLLVAMSLLGGWLLSREGRRAWARFRDAIAEGHWPGDEVTQGALVILGGALLLTPGFLTDGVGLLFLLPPTRIGLSKLIRSSVAAGAFGAAARRTSGRRRRPQDARSPDGDGLGIEVVEIRRDEGPDQLDRPDQQGDEPEDDPEIRRDDTP